MLWYHDHAMGITRLNAYAGLASAFIVREMKGFAEEVLGEEVSKAVGYKVEVKAEWCEEVSAIVWADWREGGRGERAGPGAVSRAAGGGGQAFPGLRFALQGSRSHPRHR